VSFILKCWIYNVLVQHSFIFLLYPWYYFLPLVIPLTFYFINKLRKFLTSPVLIQSIRSSFIFIHLLFRSFTLRLCVLMHFGNACIYCTFVSMYKGGYLPFPILSSSPPIYLFIVSVILSCGVPCVRTDRVCTLFGSRYICHLYIFTYLLMKGWYIHLDICTSLLKIL
jgi:hypothetical protein